MSRGRTFQNWRWLICGILFLVVVISFIDRLSFGVATPQIARDLKLTNDHIATIAAAFMLAYYPGMIIWGRVIDRVGSRAGLCLAVLWWSAAEALTGSARSVAAFSAYRFLLAAGESALGPAGVKVISEWFGVKERTSAIGIFAGGASVASVIGTPLIAVSVVYLGWPWFFYFAGAAGLLWVYLWWIVYQPPSSHLWVSDEERGFIEADMTPGEARAGAGGAEDRREIRFWEVFRYREMWGLLLARVFAEPLGLAMTTFLPKYLVEQRRFDMISMGVALAIPPVFGIAGLLTGGFVAGRMLRRGMALGVVRKRLLALGLLLQVVVVAAVLQPGKGILVALLSVVSFGAGIWSANVNALPVDIAPKYLVASVLGISAFGGGVAGLIYIKVAGSLADHIGSLTPVFVTAGAMPLLSVLAVVWILGRVERFRVSEGAQVAGAVR